MLIYTVEGKEAVIKALNESRNWGTYSEEFRNALHQKLSIIHLRDDKIYLMCGEFKATPNYKDSCVEFSCEFSLRGESGWIGGLVWHAYSKNFGLHT